MIKLETHVLCDFLTYVAAFGQSAAEQGADEKMRLAQRS